MPDVPQVGTSDGTSGGVQIPNAFGSLTQAAGTVISRLIPPRAAERLKVTGFTYICGTTPHSLTFMTVQDTGETSAAIASGGTSLVLVGSLVGFDGGILASGDYLAVMHTDGTWGAYLCSGLSGLTATIGATAKAVDAGAVVHLLGAAADHLDRRYSIPASTTQSPPSGIDRPIAVATKDNEPIFAHSDNATAAGTLFWVAWAYVRVTTGQLV